MAKKIYITREQALQAGPPCGACSDFYEAVLKVFEDKPKGITLKSAAKLIMKKCWVSELVSGKPFEVKDMLLGEIQRLRWLDQGIDWCEVIESETKQAQLLALSKNPKFLAQMREKMKEGAVNYGATASNLVGFLQNHVRSRQRILVETYFEVGPARDDLFDRAQRYAEKQLDDVKQTRENLLLKEELLQWKYDKQDLTTLVHHYGSILKVGPDAQMLRDFFAQLPTYWVRKLLQSELMQSNEHAMQLCMAKLASNSFFGSFGRTVFGTIPSEHTRPIVELSLDVPEEQKVKLEGAYYVAQNSEVIKANEKFFKGGVMVVDVNDWSQTLKEVEEFPGTVVFKVSSNPLTGNHSLLSRIKRRGNVILCGSQVLLPEICEYSGWKMPEKELEVTSTSLREVVGD
ncbi:hypothetical protein [Vibrio phage vB_VmeM-Yong XC32]|nr:hypothetical protein [Vibrio phage vB_VmeM-Yong XC31]QAX96396.1 hypothetical protein [Vibrio phage vB_VmeM-Yong XC32]QAX96713.1 hypothetical protein [Vibrio phage vB_VmeM-Yong MS31]QAX97032.1 hypothetical protein [Vibrio phage vB_VmeM-Yong MS32]